MSGPSDALRLKLAALLVVIAGAAGGLSAQYLPDIGEFEVEDVRLILLDEEGQRRGVLQGDLARKQRDGKVLVEQATLTFTRDQDRFEITAPEFQYEPETSQFDAPDGITARLPNDGSLTLPAGEGEITYEDNIVFSMNVDGEGELRSGPEGEELVQASVVNPTIRVEIAQGDDDFELKEMSVEGTRGGSLKLRLAHLPSFEQEESDEPRPALVTVSCFGNIGLRIHENGEKAALSMLRRASMKLIEEEQRTFEVTSTQLEIRGRIVRGEDDETNAPAEEQPDGAESLAASLTDLAIDASQNVRLVGEEFEGAAGVLRYREFVDRREVRLEEDPELELRQGENEQGLPRLVNLRAKVYVDVLIPFEGTETEPDAISVTLLESARVSRFTGTQQEWKITGRMVRLFSWRADDQRDEYNHAFDAYAEGFSPLLRVSPVADAPAGRDIDRAAIYGARAEGTFIEKRMQARVYGPEVLAVVDSDAPLAELFRIVLGLQKQERDENGNPVPPDPRDGRLTVRADTLLDIDLLTSSSTGDLSVAAAGRVQLDHQPLPRDDRNLLTLTGEELELAVRGGEIKRARVGAVGDARSLATLGYDLLEAKTIDIRAVAGGLRTDMAGPGRMVIRDESSVDYFRRELDRLPKISNDGDGIPEPDAAWLNFGATLSIRSLGLSRQMEGDDPDFHLVYGEFEQPRAGRSSVNDLGELIDPEVRTLYVIRAGRMFASQMLSTPLGVPVNILRLEGNPYVDSTLDGIRARAVDAIELSGSENQRSADSPFSIVLLRDARISVDEAGVFFGEYVQTGMFSYDDAWTLRARDRLEVTMRPLEGGRDGNTLSDVRKLIGESLKRRKPLGFRVFKLQQAREVLAGIVDLDTDATDPTVLQPINALPELDSAIRHGQLAKGFRAMNNAEQYRQTQLMEDAARRARSLLTTLIDVAGRGSVEGDFLSKKPNVPTLNLKMQNALFTFNGLGQVVDVDATGPIVVSRASYTITGASLKHHPDGTLTLDGASITLPEDTGVDVTGVTSVSLKQREDTSISEVYDARRTMVTRVTGRKLKVEVDLTREEEGE